MFGTIMTKMKKIYYFEIYRIYKEGIHSMFSMDSLCLRYKVTAYQFEIMQ